MSEIDYSKRRFLIADDEAFMLGLLERALRGFKAGGITKVVDGAAALKAISDVSQVDCIISDFNMSPVNGLQLLQAVRAGDNPHIPRDQAFIMLTGHGEVDVVKAALKMDVNGYLVKPVAPIKLAETLDHIFKKPIALKDAAYYRSVDLKAALPINDASTKRASAWVILPRSSPLRGKSGIEDKIERFKSENATRDGLEDVKIKNRRQCDLATAKENMILAENIEAEEGTVLLRKGTALTQTMLVRLRELAAETDSRQFIWVGELA